MANRPLVAERHRQGHIARPAAERLMRSMGLKGHPQGQDAPHDALRTA